MLLLPLSSLDIFFSLGLVSNGVIVDDGDDNVAVVVGVVVVSVADIGLTTGLGLVLNTALSAS